MVHACDLSRKWTGGQLSEEKEEEEIPVGFHIAPRACTSEQPSRPPARSSQTASTAHQM